MIYCINKQEKVYFVYIKKKNNDDLFFFGDGFEYIFIMFVLDFCFFECFIFNQFYKIYGLDFYYN